VLHGRLVADVGTIGRQLPSQVLEESSALLADRVEVDSEALLLQRVDPTAALP
jgi:hypothetical protein